jgi:hypothetical protein
LGRRSGNGQAARFRFQTATSPATAEIAVRGNLDVADFHAGIFAAANNVPFVDATAADARARENA